MTDPGQLAPYLSRGFALAALLFYLGSRRLQDEEIPRIALLTAAFFIASLVHVRLPTGDAGIADRLEAVLARHPGTDEVVLHVVVGSREVVVNSDRYHVLAGPALAAEIDELVGQAATRLETVRPKAQSNGNGRGNGGGRRAQ